ncbi:MAG: efflux RND transporter periplasmic adaptor subunit [Pseudomonadota bacterium]
MLKNKSPSRYIVYIFILFVTLPVWAKNNKTNNKTTNVTVVKIQPRDVPKVIKSIGSLYANREIEVSTQVDGLVDKILFTNGDQVKKGQLLYQLDDKLDQAKVAAMQAALTLSEITYKRYSTLVKGSAVSQEMLDKATADYKSKQANLNVAQTELEKMRIQAPFAGTIAASKVNIGQFVEEGTDLVKLIDKSSVTARFSVLQHYLNTIKLGQRVKITSTTFPKQFFNGKVTYIAPSIDNQTRTVMVWAQIPNKDLKLAPGLFVHIQLQIGMDKNAILIPQEALIPTVEGEDVFIVKNGKAYRKAITTGQTFGDQIVVSKGLQAGDTVVTLGQEKLSDGKPVNITAST